MFAITNRCGGIWPTGLVDTLNSIWAGQFSRNLKSALFILKNPMQVRFLPPVQLFNNYIMSILLGEVGVTPMSDKDTVICVATLAIVFFLYLFRHKPVCGALWSIVKIFFVVLFATLFANYLKKEIKDWWKK